MNRVASTNPHDQRAPRSGDSTVCYGCGAILLFDYELQLVEPNESELKSMKADIEIYFLLRTVQKAIREKKVIMIKGP